MRTKAIISSLAFILGACASTATAPEPAAEAAALEEASVFEAHGLRLERISGWQFLPADETVSKDTVVVLQGMPGNDALAPVVEVSRRALQTFDRRRSPNDILSAVVTELSQTFDAFDTTVTPETVKLGGLDAAKVQLSYNEMLADGVTAERRGTFYAVVAGGQVWIIRCLGPADGGADEAFESILGTLSIDAG